MNRIFIYLFFFFLAIAGSCEAPIEVLVQAKASTLWRPVSPDDTSVGWRKLFCNDPVLACWDIDETLLYVKFRTRELNEKSIATKKFLGTERLKATLITDLPLPWKAEKLYWKDTLSFPTAVDFAAASRISEAVKYKDDLNGFRTAFIEADKANPTRMDAGITAYLIFEGLFKEKAQ